MSHAEDLGYEALVWLRTWRRLGVRWRDAHATIRDPVDAAPWRRRYWFQRLGLLDIRHLDIHATPEELARALVQRRPDVLRAPPSTLEALARHLRAAAAPVRPRLIFTTGERLTPETRARVESVFGAPVRDCYGATEAGCIAWQCPRCDSYHVNSDSVLVEVLRDGRPVGTDETGEVVITNLFARAMPFVRYALGDLATLGAPCPDAPGAVTLGSLQGRRLAPIAVADGTLLSPYGFMPDDVPGIAAYRVVQGAPDRIRIVVVPGRGFQPQALERARREYQERAGRGCRVEIEVRDALPARSDGAIVHTPAP